MKYQSYEANKGSGVKFAKRFFSNKKDAQADGNQQLTASQKHGVILKTGAYLSCTRPFPVALLIKEHGHHK